MDRILDSIILLLACTWLSLTAQTAPEPQALVGCFLTAICSAGAMELLEGRVAKLLANGAFLVLAVAFPPLAVYAPLGVYCACTRHSHSLLLTAAWALPVLGSLATEGAAFCIGSVLLCILAAIMAWRTSVRQAERELLRESRDRLKEEYIALAEEARDTEKRQELELQCAILDERNRVTGEIRERASRLLRSRDRTPPFAEGLTDREREVARLIAEGRENREIASALFLSEGTVRNHISAILQKTGFKNRTQIAIAWWRVS